MDKAKMFALIVLILGLLILGLVAAWFYYTAGHYEATIYYTKSESGYTLDGVAVYARPYRLESLYEVRLISKEDISSGEFSEVLKREFGVVRFDPAKVRRHCERYDEDVECFVRIDAGVVKLKPNVATRSFLPLKALTASEPIEFNVILYPVRGGWVCHVGDVKIIVRSQQT